MYFRYRPVRSGSSESEEMNDNLDRLLLPKFRKHRYRINYMSNRDLLRLYETRSFHIVFLSLILSFISKYKYGITSKFSFLEHKTWAHENNLLVLIQFFNIQNY